ncbi:MAG: serpin family protein [Planctomycetota bacterium]|nr:MAG: serpin family protein [Planctomycetota bacterium]REJ86761.1 MAG: serpin family protein [Planctomycetota bacterium]REK23657.1 MAG: serpin family protein [Planctomycetota bacterium]REK31116.1 MAG: serpin family protein [Planctomycetota bacterium]
MRANSLFVALLLVAGATAVRAESAPDACNRVGCDLYRMLANESERDVAVSPVSLCTQLAMLRLGASRLTADELDRLLDPSGDEVDMVNAISELAESLSTTDPAEQWQSINRMWIDAMIRPPRGEFEAALNDQFGAEIVRVRFARRRDIRRVANQWAIRVSGGRVDDLVPPGWLEPDTCLILTNIMLLDAKWERPFNAAMTTTTPFHLNRTKTRAVQMMQQKSQFAYTEIEGAQVVEIPYEGDSLTMVLVVPKEIDGLASIEDGLSTKAVATWIAELSRTVADDDDNVRGGFGGRPGSRPLVTLKLPRFSVHSDSDLTGPLRAAGLKSLFSLEDADLTGISSSQPLYLQGILQSVLVDVDENGTRAGVATRGKGGFGGGERVEVKADRPFLFFVRHVDSNAIVLIGRWTGLAERRRT